MKKKSCLILSGFILLCVQSIAQNSWLLYGNIGTTPSNFIGTIDNNSLRFRANNQKAGYLGVADGNVFFGYQSGNSNTTGYSNVAIGFRSLFRSTNSQNQVAIGDSSLMNNTSGSANVAIGSRSLKANLSGYGNTAIGYQSLFSNTAGSVNTAIGIRSLFSNTTGSGNAALGNSALQGNTTGTGNTATGNSALQENTIGSGNTANGLNALKSNGTGNSNTAMGTHALYGNYAGTLNTAIGADAMQWSGGDNNTAVGAATLAWNARGNHNTAIGAGSMHSTHGSFNTATGGNSLLHNTTGNQNTGHGDSALITNITGSKNSALGFKADVFSDSLTNATAIGANTRVDCNNCLVLGSTSGVNGATNDVKVGISRTDPAFPLTFSNALGDKISFYNMGPGRNYGIGTQNLKLQFYTDIPGANIEFGYGSSASFTENMRVQGNGNVVIRGSVTANGVLYPSDLRYKKNIQPIQNALQRLTQIQGYNYNWNDPEKDSLLHVGIIAQDLQLVFPELVRTNENGYMFVDYPALIPYLIQSIKEQNEVINKLIKENERLSYLEKEIMRIKQLIEK